MLLVALALGAPFPARADPLTDGTGTMDVSPGGPVVASSTGNMLTFTYTADSSGITAGTVEIAVPSGWTAPQATDSSSPGYVSTDALLATVSATSDGTITVSNLTLLPDQSFHVTYDNATAPSAGGSAAFPTSEADGVDQPVPLSSVPSVQVLAPDGSGTMLVGPGSVPAGSSQSLTFTYTADPGGIQGGTLDLAVPSGWTAPQTTDAASLGYVTTALGASNIGLDDSGTLTIQPAGTIQVTGLTLAAGDTLVITYGDGTAPTADSYAFTTDESSAGGAPQPINAQPQVTVTPVSAPGAPSLVSATPGNGAVDLSWSAPSDDGGASVSDYVINEYVGGDTSGTPVPIDPGSTGTSAIVSGLTDGQEYTFTVQAVNSAGTGSASGALSATPVTVPGSPSLISATPGDGHVQLSWSAPSDDGGAPVSDYVINEYVGGDTSGNPTPIDMHSTSTSYTVPGLTDGQQYTFTIEAVNPVGPSSASSSLSATPATVPGTPSLTSATPGNGMVDLAWSPPTDVGGASVSDYVVYEYRGGDTSGTPTTIDTRSTGTAFSVSGLTNGQQYTFTVVAANSAGDGGPSNQLSATPVTVPGSPSLTSAQPGNGQVQLSWSGPSDDGGASVSGYVIYEYQGGDTSGTPTPVDTQSTGTSFTVSGLTNGQQYTFTVAAVSSVGTGPASSSLSATPAATAPGASTLTSATPGNGTVDLSWSAPSDDGGSSINDYVIEEYQGSTTSGTSTPVDTHSTGTSATVSGLANGTTYTFTVEAVNSVGTGPASGSLSTTPGATVPGAPSLTSATAGNGTVDLSWSAPSDDGGSSITDYVIEEYQGSDTSGTATLVDAKSTGISATVSGLRNGTTYTFTVEAVNSVGTSPASTSLTATPAAVVPGAPSLTSATAGAGEVVLSWSAPSDDGGAQISGYQVNEFQGSSTTSNPTVIDATGTSTTVSGLSNGQAYTFTVQAINTAGAGLASAALSATPATVPGAPSINPAKPGNAQVQLSWSAPSDDGGDAVDHYEIDESQAGGPTQVIETPDATPTYTVDGLTNGQPYTFAVLAVNSAGKSSPSSTVSTTPRTVPGAPTLTATPGAGQVSLSWTTPADGGAAIDDYVISQYVGSSTTPTTTTTTSTSQTVTGLTNGTTYTFAIQAVNVAGSSELSNVETATPATVPAAPQLLATVAGPAIAEVVWSPPAEDGGASIGAYDIFRSTTAGSRGTQIASQAPTSATNTYIDQSVTNGTTYYYEVVAVNRIGQSPASDQFSAEPQSSLPPPLLLKTFALDGHKVTFSAPNKCVPAGRVAGNVSISSLTAHSPKIVISKAVFKVGKLVKKTVIRRTPSGAPIRVRLRAKHMLAKHSYGFLAAPSIAIGKRAPHRHTLRLKITAC